MRLPSIQVHHDEMIVDNFAGGGGASLGIERGAGRSPDVAINHDPAVLAIHQHNHPNTRHLVGDIWEYRPLEITGGRPVGLLWASPDCRDHSSAKGGRPVSKRVRALAWVVPRWATAVRPRVIILENVVEFRDWGPLMQVWKWVKEKGRKRKVRRRVWVRNPAKKGQTFRGWVRRLEKLGYVVEHRVVRACDYGAPTIRKRLFIVARCDGMPIVWPSESHGPGRGQDHRVAAECIDWSIPCPSIFGPRPKTNKPLSEKTLARIARGVRKFVLEARRPFIAPLTHGEVRVHSVDEPLRTVTGANRGELALFVPTLVQTGYGEREGQNPRSLDLQKPLGTVVACGQKHALVTARCVATFLARNYSERETGGWNGGAAVDGPAPTVTARDHTSLVAASLVRYNGQGGGPVDVSDPLGTVTTKDRFGLVAAHVVKLYGSCTDGQAVDAPMGTVTAGGWHLGAVQTLLQRFEGTCTDGQAVTVEIGGETYAVVDIGMRMLEPHELAAAQGFPASYRFDVKYKGKPLSKTAQVKAVGNSVSPPPAEALVAANYGLRRAQAA